MINSQMRKQYHFCQVGEDIYIWDVHSLVALSEKLNVKEILITDIQGLNEAYWFPDTHPTTQQMIEHMQLVNAADLSYPIILCAEGRVMDGMHRIAKAILGHQTHILAVQFEHTPKPNFINVDEGDLDYA